MQALCPVCHSRKTKRDHAKRAKVDQGEDDS
jgi:5-methylcytosine-specific restriction endonuclease McrA